MPELAEVTSPLRGEWMTPRRRFLSAVYRGNVDKIPACTLSSVVTVEMMDLVDAAFPEAHLDAEKMARLAGTAHDVFGMDTIMPVFHSQLESDALGGETEWAEKDNWPSPSRFTITEPEQVKVPDDYLQRPTMAAVTGAIKLLRHRYPDVAIVGKVYGPWSVGYQMVGIEDFLMDVMLDPDKIKRYLDAFLPACIASARAQFEAGADAVMWADHTTGDLCRAETYRDFLLEMHQHITQEMGGPGIFHCCGKTIDRVHLFAAAGWDVFHFESQVDAREARAMAGERTLADGQPEQPDPALAGHARGRLQGVLGPDGRGRGRPRAGGLGAAGDQEGTAHGHRPRGPRLVGQAPWRRRHRPPARPLHQHVYRLPRPARLTAPDTGEQHDDGGPQATPDGRGGR